MTSPARVAFLGPEGTYTHQAVVQQFGNDPTRVKCLPEASIQACFDRINTQTADYAVVPLENSTNGLVVFTYDLLRDWYLSSGQGNGPEFHIVAEQFVEIHHYLYSRASDLSKVEKLYSHPQVWGQVSRFLQNERFNGNYSRIDTNSTAQAAEKVYQDTTNTSACISLKMSGHIYNIPTKAAEIEDLKGNTTRFLVLGQGSMLRSEENGESNVKSTDKQEKALKDQACLTSLIFVLNGNEPGALCEAIYAFKTNEINLTSISSRPLKVTPWEYVFFVEAEGAGDSNAMQKSLIQLREHCLKVAILGLFVRSWRYKKETQPVVE